MRIRLLASTAAPTRISKCLRPLNGHRFIPRPRNQHRDAALNAGAEALGLLERFTALQSVLLGRLVSSALRDGDLGDAGLFAVLYILGAEEAAIGRVQFRWDAEGLLVTIQ